MPTSIPPTSRMVAAYQFGRGLVPLVKTAKPIEQTRSIQKPL